MLEVSGLQKSFGALRAVDGVSFRVEPGEILGLLGPNGAGKTTTVSMICGLLPPDAGSVTVVGRPLAGDTDPSRMQLGLVPQDLALYEELSARDNLAFFGALYGLGGTRLETAIASALDFVGLSDRARDRVKVYSGGMKRRLNLAAGLLHDPQVLLLDEPTVGVDPQSRNAIFDNLEALRSRGKTILYTTHYMEEAERLCDRIVIVDHGKVLADDTLSGLTRLLPAANRLRVELAFPAEGGWIEGIRSCEGVLSATAENHALTLHLSDLAGGIPVVLAYLGEHRVAWTHLQSDRAGLEEIFLHLTGRRLRDA